MLIARVLRRWRRSRDDGAVLVAVLGAMALGLLVVSLISTTVVNSMGHTSAVRAGVQSQAAAEAGVDAARALVDANLCTTSLLDHSSSTYSPQYRVQIAWRSNASATWSNRCPVYQKGQVRYTSTGYAQSPGVAGQAVGDTAHVESIYGAPAVTSINGTGAAIYSYGTAGGTGLSGILGSISGTGASVQVYQGDAACNGVLSLAGILSLTTINADVLVRDGNFTMSACTVSGNVSAGGDLPSAGTVTMTGADLLHATQISGSVTAKALAMTGYATVTGGATVQTTPTRTSVPILLGNKSPTLSGYTITHPANPVVPDWTEFDYQGASQWPGFVVRTLTASQCNAGGITLALSGLLSTQPVVLDAQACTSGISAVTISLTRSVALIVPNTAAVNLSAVGLSLPVGTSGTKFWVVQPDADVSDGVPTCPAGASLTTGAINLDLVPTMIYTPCTYNETGLIGSTNGQIYAGMASLSTALSLGRTYTPIGLPGVDLTTGTATTTGPRLLLSNRNVQSGP